MIGTLGQFVREIRDLLTGSGDPIPVDIGTNIDVTIDNTSIEISNDVGNPIPVNDAGGSLTVDSPQLTSIDGKLPALIGGRVPVDIAAISIGDVEIKNDSGNPVPASVASLGASADAAATTDTGTFSLIALAKRGLQNWTSLLAKVPTLTVTSARLLVDGSGVTQPISDASGSLTIDGKAYRSTATITRPSNTTAYTAGDVVGDTGGSAIISLTAAGPTAGFVIIQSISLVFSDSTVPAMGAFRLHLYSASPTAVADNAAFDLTSGERATYMGYVDLPAPQDLGSSLYTQTDYPGRLIKLAAASTTLFAELETRGAYTPVSASTVAIRVNLLEAGL